MYSVRNLLYREQNITVGVIGNQSIQNKKIKNNSLPTLPSKFGDVTLNKQLFFLGPISYKGYSI